MTDVLLTLTVVAGEDIAFDVEVSGHRLVVSDALGVIALHDAVNLVGRLYGLLFHHFVVADNAEDDVGGDLSLTLMIPVFPTFCEG